MRRWANILCCTLVLVLLAAWAPGCRDVSEERYGEKSENDSGKLERQRQLFPDVTPSPPPSPTAGAGAEPEAEAAEAEAPEAETPSEPAEE